MHSSHGTKAYVGNKTSVSKFLIAVRLIFLILVLFISNYIYIILSFQSTHLDLDVSIVCASVKLLRYYSSRLTKHSTSNFQCTKFENQIKCKSIYSMHF